MKASRYLLLFTVLILLVLGIAYSSSMPDGLETVARKLHFISAERSLNWSLLKSYQICEKLPEVVNHILSALVGSIVLLFMSFGIARLRESNPQKDKGNS